MSPPDEALKLAKVSAHSVRWCLRRNCSVSPAQLAGVYAGLSTVSLGISVLFWFQGAALVLPFALVEVLALGAALLVYARHATDFEQIVLERGRLVVERVNGRRTERAEFVREWVRVEPGGRDALVEVVGQGCKVAVGRHLRADLRPALAREIRWALRAM